MRKDYLLVLLLLTISSISAKYNEALANELVYVSGLAYCKADKILAGKCGRATQETETRGIEPLHSIDNGLDKNGITMSILKNDGEKTLYVAFSGTRNTDQLITEIAEAFPVSYEIHPEVKGAKVFDYFYSRYVKDFKDDFNEKIFNFMMAFDDYKIIFTGHSLGGAMTVHA